MCAILSWPPVSFFYQMLWFEFLNWIESYELSHHIVHMQTSHRNCHSHEWQRYRHLNDSSADLKYFG